MFIRLNLVTKTMIGALTEQEIEDMLRNHNLGRIGCNDGMKTYVVPVNFVFEDNYLLCHSRDGMKIEMMRQNPEVCFEIDEIIDNTHWRSVIAWGTYVELTDENDIAQAQKFLSSYLLSLKTVNTPLPPETQQERYHSDRPDYLPAIYYKIILKEISGRFERSL